ncbi:MAG: uncharacterized protein QG565_694 [Campylobacterota bacterium]|nr:uncharacterized protein [Campylobacterota bacterium]MDQ1267984.1 uncharacterized protein [Campylobacterota bacterium]
MLKILFSPAEGKKSGGNEKKQELFGSNSAREGILGEYNNIVNRGDKNEIKELFGFKNFAGCEPYICDIFNSPLMPAIERYDGVAYDYLDFNSLDSPAKEYLKSNTIIFSNLYGPLLGGDAIANYKVKQGNNIGSFVPDKFYKERFSYQLDLYLANCEILDLRAGYYDKFYEVKKPYTTLKFLKDGKTVSHWAKAYRGLVLRTVAQSGIDSIAGFMKMEIEGIYAKEIIKKGLQTEIVFEIV